MYYLNFFSILIEFFAFSFLDAIRMTIKTITMNSIDIYNKLIKLFPLGEVVIKKAAAVEKN